MCHLMALSADELTNRIVAARVLRGLEQEQVGPLMKEEGYGLHDIPRIERQEPKAPKFHEGRRRALAKVLRVPESWFTAPADAMFPEAKENDELRDQLARMEDAQEDIIHRLDYLIANVPGLVEPYAPRDAAEQG